MAFSCRFLLSCFSLLALAAPAPVLALAADQAAPPRAWVTQKLDETRRVALPGSTRTDAADPSNDLGPVPDSFRMDHILLQLRPPAAREAALQLLLQEQQQPGSAAYHQWLTAAQYGERFGLAAGDIAAITDWLAMHGFTVNRVYPNRLTIDFSGTAAQVREALHAEIHTVTVRGERHVANVNDPDVPAALAPAIAGVTSLNDFRPHATHTPVRAAHFDPKGGALLAARGNAPSYSYTSGGSTYQAVAPADLATIYHLSPLFAAGYTGRGQTIVVIEDTNVYATADWTTFRSTFGLAKYTTGSFTQVHPGGCSNPGVNGDDGEAILDAEWASAAAPGAAIQLASCADTSATFGGLIALHNLINASTQPPAIVSISYGECEAENGASANATYSNTYKQAAAEGVSVFVSSGDEGAASCDPNVSQAIHGIDVSGLASSAYNVAVGGTDFGDTYANTNSTYWSSTNSSTYGSAKSYINEIPWNDSCASQLIAKASSGSTLTYGSGGFCNSATGTANFLTTASGSGGPSGCFTGVASSFGVVSGTCKGNAKPAWQTGVVGLPADGVRDLPDVSLFAANGVWGHYYVFCYSDIAFGGAACTGAPLGWSGAGGTSFAAPIMAAIQSLVNQKTSARWGNPNSMYYKLAASEYGTTGSASCNSSKGRYVSSTCIFYDVTQGDMDVNCTGTHGCYRPSGSNGVLSKSNTSYVKAFGAGTGWDFATGLGSVNAYNLVMHW